MAASGKLRPHKGAVLTSNQRRIDGVVVAVVCVGLVIRCFLVRQTFDLGSWLHTIFSIIRREVSHIKSLSHDGYLIGKGVKDSVIFL